MYLGAACPGWKGVKCLGVRYLGALCLGKEREMELETGVPGVVMVMAPGKPLGYLSQGRLSMAGGKETPAAAAASLG